MTASAAAQHAQTQAQQAEGLAAYAITAKTIMENRAAEAERKLNELAQQVHKEAPAVIADRAALASATEQVAQLKAEMAASQLRESEISGSYHNLQAELGRLQIEA